MRVAVRRVGGEQGGINAQYFLEFERGKFRRQGRNVVAQKDRGNRAAECLERAAARPPWPPSVGRLNLPAWCSAKTRTDSAIGISNSPPVRTWQAQKFPLCLSGLPHRSTCYSPSGAESVGPAGRGFSASRTCFRFCRLCRLHRPHRLPKSSSALARVRLRMSPGTRTPARVE